MTVSLKMHVNGNYQVKLVHTSPDGRTEEITVGPNEERQISWDHGGTNAYVGEETYLGDVGGAAPAGEKGGTGSGPEAT